MKNAFITEAETVNAGTKLTVTDIEQQQGGEHRQERQKQGRDEHSERKGVGMPPSEEELRKEAVKSVL